jgi:hypothetical protein
LVTVAAQKSHQAFRGAGQLAEWIRGQAVLDYFTFAFADTLVLMLNGDSALSTMALLRSMRAPLDTLCHPRPWDL